MATLSEKIARWGLTEIGFGCMYYGDGSVVAWTGENSRKGYVIVWPPEPGLVFAPTVEIAMERLSVLAL